MDDFFCIFDLTVLSTKECGKCRTIFKNVVLSGLIFLKFKEFSCVLFHKRVFFVAIVFINFSYLISLMSLGCFCLFFKVFIDFLQIVFMAIC